MITTVSVTHPEFVRLHELLQSEYVGMYGLEDPDPDAHIEVLDDQGTVALLLNDGNENVGIVSWTPNYETAIMHRMYVHFRHRRRGYAKALLAAVEETARNLAMRRVELETGTHQVNAIMLYLAQGYKPSTPFGYYAKFADTTSVFLGKDL